MANPARDGNILVWGAEDIEPETIEQARRTAALPFVFKPLALMPDAHIGIGATIGSVAFMHGAIVPAAVGVDIGCGMVASLTNLCSEQLPDDLSPLLSLIEQRVPAGVGKGHDSDRQPQLPPFPKEGFVASLALDPKQRKTVLSQFGSLGSGNHFVEVCLDESGRVWVVLHSGSRGIGNKLAQTHINDAKRLMAKYFITLDDPDLAYFVEHTPEFDAYVADMLWAQKYAAANRDEMAGKTWQGNDAKALLDEHPSAYKDVEAVMAAQADLVRIDHRLSQVLNYKGTK